MKGLKVFRGKRWTLQLYWPEVWAGGLGSYGIRANTGLIFSRYADGGWAAGFQMVGLGFGVAASGVPVPVSHPKAPSGTDGGPHPLPAQPNDGGEHG